MSKTARASNWPVELSDRIIEWRLGRISALGAGRRLNWTPAGLHHRDLPRPEATVMLGGLHHHEITDEDFEWRHVPLLEGIPEARSLRRDNWRVIRNVDHLALMLSMTRELIHDQDPGRQVDSVDLSRVAKARPTVSGRCGDHETDCEEPAEVPGRAADATQLSAGLPPGNGLTPRTLTGMEGSCRRHVGVTSGVSLVVLVGLLRWMKAQKARFAALQS
jgi:hypothetical protein